MHFFIKPQINIDCFTNRRDVIEYAPVVNAIETIPTWWKNLPKERTDGAYFYPTSTMKTCVGMYDYYAKSIAMPLWSDLAVNIISKDNYGWQFSDGTTESGTHNKQEYVGLLDSQDFGHLKILSPWLFYTKQDVTWVVSEPIYNRKTISDYVLAQGVLNFSKQHATNLQMIMNTEIPNKFIMPFGTPFLFTPLSDKKVVIHRHLISNDDFMSKKETAKPITFGNKYKAQQKITKCPYKDFLK